jgi:hypothetical protein
MGSRRSTGRPTARGSRIFQRPRAARATGNMIGTTARKRAVHSFMASSVAPTLSHDSISSPTVLTRHDLPLKRQASTGIPPIAIPAARYRLLGAARRAALGAARRRSAARADQRHVRRESPQGETSLGQRAEAASGQTIAAGERGGYYHQERGEFRAPHPRAHRSVAARGQEGPADEAVRRPGKPGAGQKGSEGIVTDAANPGHLFRRRRWRRS